ncbi:helix-turn-helix domain-containing protein [Pararobbsia silviterrae]|uniref:XRE family transcriptional regulator n=1 Tax=Pararobbsia silviterrae TaxID=1792498 RepID=A0A494XNH1_9BURK|nr:helix-turn-helix transcriptional regulator [Pararobbsia silviterrae]RKP49624.1 XRE family transcriptional regulator [Pararobbsia silviterrae]
MTTLVHRIGRHVRALREARQWSQEQLAERAGLNRSYIGEVERGTVIASVVTVDKIAQALDLSLSELLRLAPLPSGPSSWVASPQTFASDPTDAESPTHL